MPSDLTEPHGRKPPMWVYELVFWCGFGAPFAQKSGVKSQCEFTKPAVRKPTFIAFDSRVVPFTNDILRKRYGENTSVNDTLEWLAEQGVGCSREGYQKYLRRLLYHLPDAQALEMGIELPMLHAVRRRLGLPLEGRRLRRMPYVRGSATKT